MAGKPWHRGAHPRIARAVVAAANANPTYTCPTCRMTRTEGIARWGTNGEWEGGHRVHGQPEYGYHAQHAHCNRSEGATYGNLKRLEGEPHSERW